MLPISAKVDHKVLKQGIYASRTGARYVTYDIRLIEPLKEGDKQSKAISLRALHLFEHIFAKIFREVYPYETVYVGPMGCGTGMYAVMYGEFEDDNVVYLVQRALQYVTHISSKKSIPFANFESCGNANGFNIKEAHKIAENFLKVIEDYPHVKVYPLL